MIKFLFSRFWHIFVFLIKLFKVLPSFIRSMIWSFSDNKSSIVFIGLRYLVFSSRVQAFSKNTYLGKYLTLKNISNLKVGENVSIHDYCYLDAVGGIEIGNNVSIAHNCSLVSFNHTWSDIDLPIKYNPVIKQTIRIEDDVWVGCGARIMPGVTIHSRSVVAAGSVVISDVPPNSLVAGVPSKVVKNI